MAPVIKLYVPFKHVWQSPTLVLPVVLRYVRTGQLVQFQLPVCCVENEPAGHVVQTCNPSALAKVPGVQDVHAVRPLNPLPLVPFLQFTHARWLSYVPVGQTWHATACEAPSASRIVPFGQGVQSCAWPLYG